MKNLIQVTFAWIFFSLFLFEVDLYKLSKKIYIYLLFLELELSTKQSTTKEKINLFLFIECIKKKLLKWT